MIAPAVTREGLPVRSWVFPGNTSDVLTVRSVRNDLRGWKLGRVLFVGDTGLNSEENRRALVRGGGRYVLACGTSSTSEVLRDVLGRPGRFKTIADKLHLKEVVVGEGELRRRYLVCRNPQEADRQRAHRAHDGKWVLITNDDAPSAEDAAQAYKARLPIERRFRTMKSVQIEVRPMFHRLDRRIVAHLKICVLSLLLSRVAELATGQTWPRVRRELRSLQATELNVDQHGFLQRSGPWAACLEHLKALDIELPSKILDTWPPEQAHSAT